MTSPENPGRSRLGWMLRPYAGRLALAVVLLIGLTGVNILVPQLIGMVFNQVLDQANWGLLWAILSAMLALFVARNLLYFYSKVSAVRVGEDLAFELRNRLFERLQQMNLQYYRTNKPGSLSSRVMNDSFAIQTFIQDELPKLCQAVLLFVGIIAAMYATNWQLALAATIVLPLHLVAFHYFKGPIKAASRSAQEHMAEATGNLIEKFLGMEVVKGFTAERRESQAFESAIDASRQSQLRSKRYHVSQKVAADLLIGLGLIGLIGFGAFQVMTGRMEAGYLITFFIYVKEVNPTVVEMMSGFAKLTKTSASVDRVTDVLQTPGAESEDRGSRPEIRGKVAFDRVSFSYPDSGPVLRDISFEVEPGEVCAIVGHSGAGKSTMVNLVPRFHDPDVGRVIIDDIDAREIDRHHLRRSVSIAFQECFLFNSTILENLRYARPNASRAQIVEVCKRIGADDFIVRLPHGYNTTVGENGVTLSRGQKQLINLARAMLKNPSILILDEATASIDEAREKQTIQAILQFMKGKTTLMITHRPEMLQHAHKVLQLVEGEVTYFGPPQEAQRMVPTPQPQSEVSFDADYVYRPDRPDEPLEDDDRPDARPSGSGIWRGIKIVALAAVIGLGTFALPESAVLADNGNTEAVDNGNANNDTAAEAAVTAQAAEAAAAEAAEAAATAQAAAERAAAAQEAVEEAEAAEAAAEAKEAAEAAAAAASEAAAAAERVAAAETAAEESATAAQSAAATAATEAAEAQTAAEAAAASRDAVVAAIQEAMETDPEAMAEALEQVEQRGRGEGEFMAIPGLRGIEASELIEVVISRLGASIGYRRASDDLARRLPSVPPELEQVTVLSHEDDDGRVHMLQLGYKTFATQPTHLWIYGQTVTDGEAAANDDLSVVREMIEQGRAARDERDENLTVADLATRIIPLSYAEPDRAIGVLKSFGYETVEYTSGGGGVGGYSAIQPSQTINPENLPIIMALPGPENTGLVRGWSDNQGNPQNLEHTTASPLMELLVLYDPGRPEQFAEVRQRIIDTVDKPARQVLVEAMVLEVSERGIQQLGIEWDLAEPFTSRPWTNIQDLTLGRQRIFEAGEGPTLDVRLGRVFGHFDVRLDALLREGEAEILSRPSVLTLDNRQASINVGERIPIAKSIVSARVDRVDFDFEYIDVGIFLNLRPRVSAEGDEVSMQISGEVSAEVPGQGLEIRDPGTGVLVGSAPRISERRVLTYSRIANNTPFIIGGLISKDNQQEIDKVPLLGDIPIIKHLFRSVRIDELTREVIIVITPYVLPENQVVGRHIPKDEDAFDSFDHELFRDAYRIRDEDVFDLTFLTENPQLRRMQRIADRIDSRDHVLAQRYPFNRFVKGRIPGERALVFRQMYEVINRLGLQDEIGLGQVLFFEPQPDLEEGFSVAFMGNTLDRLAYEAWTGAFPQRDPRYMPDPLQALQDAEKAIAMTYILRDEAEELLDQPVVNIRLIDVPDRQTWSRELWRLNQPDEDGRQRYTVLIHNERDLHRLRSALMLEKVVDLNASDQDLTLHNFSIGRQLLMPAVKPDQMYVIDSDVAMYFFMTEQYYPALQQELQRDSRALQEALQRSDVRRHLGSSSNQQRRPTIPYLEALPADE